MVKAKAKGKAGEREAAEWLDIQLFKGRTEIVFNPRAKGTDLIISPFYFEIKRREKIALDKWWGQVYKDATNVNCIPVVMFRQNNRNWQFLISARAIGCNSGWLHITAPNFIHWASKYVESKEWLRGK